MQQTRLRIIKLNNPGSLGFTLVEAVIVVMVIGIIAAVTMSRVLRDDTYNAFLARDQITSLARSAQQRAIGRNDVSWK